MKNRNLTPLFMLISTISLLFLPINLIFTQAHQSLPIWLYGLNGINNSPNDSVVAPPNDEDIILKTSGGVDIVLNNPEVFEGKNETETNILCNLTRSSYDNLAYTKYNDVNDYVLSTAGFNSTNVNLTFFNIYFNGYTFPVETDRSDLATYQLPYLSNFPRYYMSFKLDQGISAYLESLEINVRRKLIGVTTITINCIIWNSHYNSLKNRPEPLNPIASLTGFYSSLGPSWDWVSCSGNVFLNTTATYNSTFFVMPYFTDNTATLYWNYFDDAAGDGLDEGFAYQETALTSFTLLPIDFCLRSVKLTYQVPKPSQIQMRVNGTQVRDGPLLTTPLSPGIQRTAYSGNYFNGSVINGESGRILFDVTTNSSQILFFMVNLTVMLEKEEKSITQCYAIVGEPIVNWNVTVQNINFPSRAYYKRIFVRVPISWNVSGVYYQNGTEELWVNETDYGSDPPSKIVRYNVTANGSWIVDCNGTNLAGSIFVYNFTDKVEAYSYYLNDTVQVNASHETNPPMQGNLTVFNPENITVHTEIKNTINNVTSFSPWQIFQKSTKNGTYYLRVVWFNGTQVGINMTTISCINEPTNLTVSAGPDPDPVIQGGVITARIFYNDTYDDKGIPGAILRSNWTYSGLNKIDFGNGSYNITFNTLFAPINNYTIKINASKAGFDVAETIIEFEVKNQTELVDTILRMVNSTPYEPIYVNDTKKCFVINYTYQINGSGITGASIQTTPDWSEPYFQAEDLSIGNASLKGLYKILLDTTGTHADETHIVNFFATKPKHAPATTSSSLFQIKVIPTAIDVTGFENLTAFEGESVQIAAYYKDNYHAGNPAITTAEVNWTANTTEPKSGAMQLQIVIYGATLNLPELGIPPGTYNVTIKAQAPDFQYKSRNITLNVLPKYNTTIWITNQTSSEIRVGKDVTIAAEIQFSNESIDREGLKLFYDIKYSNGFSISDFRITNSSGITTYVINPILNITWINATVSYEGTEQIHSNSSNLLIPVLPKYETNVTIHDEYLETYLISGEILMINASLKYNNSGTWSAFVGENVKFSIIYEGLDDETFIIATDANGNATLELEIPEEATSLIIQAEYAGNSSYKSAFDVSALFTVTKYNVSIEFLNLNPLEVMVGSPLLLYCKLTHLETGLPLANQTVTFFVCMGDSNFRLFSQSAVTNEEGIATTMLLLLQPFEGLPLIMVGVEYSGDVSHSKTSSVSSFPIIPMSTTKYVTNFLNDNWWWIALTIGAAVAISIAYRYTIKLPRQRREIELQKKITQRVKDALNLKHAMVVHKLSGSSLYDQGFGIELDSDLIGGFLTAISAFQTEIGVKKKKEVEEEKGFELNYADFKILLTDGKLVRFAFITDERASDSFQETAGEVTRQFEEEHHSDLVDWGGALAPFKTTYKLLENKFQTGLSGALKVKSLSKKETKHFPDLTQTLIKIATSEQDKKGHFYIDDVTKIAIPARKEEEHEIYYAIYNLYQNRIFFPAIMAVAGVYLEGAKAEAVEIQEKPEMAEEEPLKEKGETVKGVFIPNLKTAELEKLKEPLESMSKANQALFIKSLTFIPDEKREKEVKDFLKQREKLNNELNKNSTMLEQLLQKETPPLAEVYKIMEDNKKIYEELGNEEKASILALDIQEMLEKFDSINETKELRSDLSDIINKAKEANEKSEFLKAAILYRKAARLYVEMGNNEDAEKVGEIANYCEQKASY